MFTAGRGRRFIVYCTVSLGLLTLCLLMSTLCGWSLWRFPSVTMTFVRELHTENAQPGVRGLCEQANTQNARMCEYQEHEWFDSAASKTREQQPKFPCLWHGVHKVQVWCPGVLAAATQS